MKLNRIWGKSLFDDLITNALTLKATVFHPCYNISRKAIKKISW
jgi:hypothetical protein